MRVASENCRNARPFDVVGSESISLTTLDAIKPSLPSIDFLQIDVQGAELQVLQGAAETLKDIAMLELEMRFYPIYEHEPLFGDVHAFLSARGFLLSSMMPQGKQEFGATFVEVNACYYNTRIAQSQPERLESVKTYSKNKHALYGNSLLRLTCDLLPPPDKLPAQVVEQE